MWKLTTKTDIDDIDDPYNRRILIRKLNDGHTFISHFILEFTQ